MINMIVDYKNPEGVFMHGAFQALTLDPSVGTASVIGCLQREGCTPGRVVCVHGDYSLAQLSEMADQDAPPPGIYEITHYDHVIMNEEG